MARALSKPLNELPYFLSTISMVVDDERQIVRDLKQAERKSPAVYGPAKDHFIIALEGKLPFEKILDQAKKLSDPTERKCAVDVLRASKKFLEDADKSPVRPIPTMSLSLPDNLELKIGPIWTRRLNPERLLVLHFWETALKPRQLKAAATALKKAIQQQQKAYADCDLDFVSLSIPEGNSSRRFKCYSWSELKPLTFTELDKFWAPLCSAWKKYKAEGPRFFTKRGPPTMFD